MTTTPRRLAAALLATSLLVSGCAHGLDPAPDDAAEAPGSPARVVEPGGLSGVAAVRAPVVAAAAADDPSPWADTIACSVATQYVYVLSAEGEIHRFSPSELAFERVGRPSCLPDGVAMFSMAVDRHARAFVLAQDQRVYRVDLESGACARTVVDRAESALAFRHFGMAYVADPSAPEGESLFVREAWVGGDVLDPVAPPDPGYRRLATLDPDSGRFALRGSGEGVDADLTGTGDGRLFAFIMQGDQASQVGVLDTTTGALGARWALPDVEITGGWAVAAWGGAVWLFSSNPGETARARRFRPELGVVDLVSGQAGFHVVGAGVSTCAPTTTTEPSPIEPPS
jgi:hypothetical protein